MADVQSEDNKREGGSIRDVPSEEERTDPSPEISKTEWKPGPGEWLILICLAIVSLVVALDATILVPVLPVCFFRRP